MSAARELVKGVLDTAALIDRLGDDDDLITSGVNSGELVRIALRCEERLGRVLTDDELAGLNTIRAVARLVEEPHARPPGEERRHVVDPRHRA